MTSYLNPKLDHPAYHTPICLAEVIGPLSVFQATNAADGATILRKANPYWTVGDHQNLGDLHAFETARQLMSYGQLLDQASEETLGRTLKTSEYQNVETFKAGFSDSMRDKLRRIAYARRFHEVVAQAHMNAAHCHLG